VGFVSASGALMMALYGVFHDHHLGLSRLISLGNQMGVTLAKGLFFLARTAGLLAHVQEEMTTGKPFGFIPKAPVVYTGLPERPLPPA